MEIDEREEIIVWLTSEKKSTVGRALAAVRRFYSLNQTDFEEAGLSTATVSNVEREKCKVTPRSRTYGIYLDVLRKRGGLSWADLKRMLEKYVGFVEKQEPRDSPHPPRSRWSSPEDDEESRRRMHDEVDQYYDLKVKMKSVLNAARNPWTGSLLDPSHGSRATEPSLPGRSVSSKGGGLPDRSTARLPASGAPVDALPGSTDPDDPQ